MVMCQVAKDMPKNPHAVELGKLGGRASSDKLTAKQRKARATNAVKARIAKSRPNINH